MLPLSRKDFLGLAHNIASELGQPSSRNFLEFLGFAYDFPRVLNKKGGVSLAGATTASEVERYLRALMTGYARKRDGRVEVNPVSTVPDPAVDVVLEAFSRIPKTDLPVYSQHHRISMAAENKVGDLLELYLAECLEPEGWFWCCTNVVKGVDFLKPGTPVVLMQVKNRDNSENSSSSTIRDYLKEHGCPVEIRKWHRCKSSDGSTCWQDFPGNEGECLASERGFREFVREYATRH